MLILLIILYKHQQFSYLQIQLNYSQQTIKNVHIKTKIKSTAFKSLSIKNYQVLKTKYVQNTIVCSVLEMLLMCSIMWRQNQFFDTEFKLSSPLQSNKMENINTSNKKYRKVGPYILIKPIGKGAYSTVYEAKKEGGTEKYAVKQISLDSVNPKQLQRIHLQIKVLSLIKHRNIVCLLDYKQTSRNLYLVFQFCRHTDLQRYNEKYCLKELPEQKVRKIAIQIKNAFTVLRANKVVHRDLKLANILVTDDYDIKIADFGFANLLDDDQFFKSYVGTPLTMAPEILENRSYNEKCDLWSLGIVLYQLLFGKNPFFTKDRMTKGQLKNATKAKLDFPQSISNQAADLLKKLIVREPSQRISFQDFFKHPWLNQGSIKDNLSQQLLQEALRMQIGQNILPVSKKKQEKEYLLKHGQDLLAYEIIQSARFKVETRMMNWVNLAKKILGLDYHNKMLVFLATGVLISNIRASQSRPIFITINSSYQFTFSNYSEMVQCQSWQLSEYTKRMPGFIQRSLKKFTESLSLKKQQYMQLFKNQQNKKLIDLYILELTNEIANSSSESSSPEIDLFLKVKPFSEFNVNIRATSSILKEKTIGMMLRRTNLRIENSRMLKRLHGTFVLENVHRESPEDKIYERLKHWIEENN